MSKDYYNVLGVDRGATAAEIKTAYRKKAMEFHPDRNAGDKSAEEKFKEVNEAYAVLSDPEKRRQFDQFGAEGFGKRFSQEDIFRGFDFGSVFNDFGFDLGSIFGGGHGRRSAYGGSFGADPFGGFGGGSPKRRGSDLRGDLTISFDEALFGSERSVKTPARTVTVRVPPGIESGKVLRVRGQGSESPSGGPPGDLLLDVRVAPHPRFTRNGRDVETEVEVNIFDALLGTSIEVPTLREGNKKLKLKTGTQPGTRVRMKGLGAAPNGQGAPGDQYVRVRVKLPEELTDQQRELLEKARDA